MKALKILFYLLLTATSVQTQSLFDAKRLKLLDSLIELEIPSEEPKWLEGRAGFCRSEYRHYVAQF